MADNETSLALAPILNLPPVSKEQMHLEALRKYIGLLDELYNEVRLDRLTVEDLTEDEKLERQRLTDGIVKWVKSSAPATYNSFSQSVIFDIGRLKALLKGAYERKLLYQRRLQALEEIDPPIEKAKKFLNGAEYEKFCQSLTEVADAYLSRDIEVQKYYTDAWILKAQHYDYWVLTIEEREQAVARREQAVERKERADLERSQFIKNINDTVQTFRKGLAREKKPMFRDRLARYAPGSWCPLKLASKEEIEKWVLPQIEERLPPLLKELVAWEIGWETRILPTASYLYWGVPCLRWHFGIEILVKVHLKLRQATLNMKFCGYRYDIPVEAGDLGSYYIRPVAWDCQEGFNTPIALLSMFAKDLMEEDGIEVSERNKPFTVFLIEGFDDYIQVHDEFRRFIKDAAKSEPLALGKALLAKDMIDEDTAELVTEKSVLPLSVEGTKGAPTTSSNFNDSELISALENMGFKKTEIQEKTRTAVFSPGMSLEDKIRAIFKNMNT